MKFLLPLILLLLGLGGGVGAGLFLKPEPEPVAEIEEESTETEQQVVEEPVVPENVEYAKLNNQFVVPVVEDGRVASLVVMSLNLEVAAGGTTEVFSSEPKLRDIFLQVMFNHANIGGFSGNFTSGTNMRSLRNELLRGAKDVLGDTVTDVLIIDIVRQDA